MSDEEEVWTAVAQLLRAQLTESVWFSTFQDVVPVVSDEHNARRPGAEHARPRPDPQSLPGDRHRGDGRDRHRRPPLRRRDRTLASRAADQSAFDELLADPSAYRADNGNGRRSTDGFSSDAALDEAGLNPRYTFDTFVKGASNQFPLAAALRVAETPARSYNPLFIYGSAGLGKTHLLHAIGHYVHHNYQHHEVRYVSTETFMNEYVDAIRSNSMAGLRRRYRDVDVLLIDDVQFLEGKEGLQEEFFHTFNALHGANKQIVISSDRMPDAIPTLEERLRGRFKWGLITDIQPPDLETRLAILRNKSERDRVQVPAETLEFIASHISTNIRELEGALIRVTAFASLNQVPITTELAQQQLADLLTESTLETAHRRRVARRDRQHLGIRGRGVEGQEPPTTARHRPPDRDVRVPRHDRSQLPQHRPPVRWARPHHRHPRRREDPTPDGRTQADLRTGHRPATAAEVMSDARSRTRPPVDGALSTCRDRGVSRGGQPPVVHRITAVSSPTWGSTGTTAAQRSTLYAGQTMGCPQSTAPTTTTVLLHTTA